MPKGTHNDTEYQRNRRKVLAGHPMCYWCEKKPADTVDHLIELDRGGDHSLSNLVPACRSCNSRRGARYGNVKHGITKATTTPRPPRKVATKASKGGEGTPPGSWVGGTPTPDRPESSVYLAEKRRKTPKNGAVLHDDGDEHLIRPRLETTLSGGHGFGPAVVEWGRRHLEIDAYAWQAHNLTGLLEHDGTDGPDGPRLRHRMGLTSVARQQGKTVSLKMLIGWWLTEMPLIRRKPQTVISTAHRLDLATALFSELAPVLEAQFGGKAKWSFGRNELAMPDGSTWIVQAASPSAGHGRSPDLIVVDEVWSVSSEVIDQGLIPSQRARFSPLLAMWSTAGDESSEAMMRWREAGIQAIEKGAQTNLYFAEWSPPSDVQIMARPDLWVMANPAIADPRHPLTLEMLQAEADGPNRAAFLRSSLNMWIAADHGWLEPGLWEQARWSGAPLPPPTVLAVDSSLDDSRYVGIWAHPTPGGVVVRVAFTVGSEVEMWDEIERQLPARGCTLIIGESLDLHCPTKLKTRRVLCRWTDLKRWTGTVRLMIAEGRLWHVGELALTEHVTRAVATRTGGTTMLSSTASPGPIELARTMVFAAATASKPVKAGKPVVVGGGR